MWCVKLNSEEANSKDILKALKWCDKKGFKDILTDNFCKNVTWWSDREFCGNKYSNWNNKCCYADEGTIFVDTFKEFKKEVKRIIKGK